MASTTVLPASQRWCRQDSSRVSHAHNCDTDELQCLTIAISPPATSIGSPAARPTATCRTASDIGNAEAP